MQLGELIDNTGLLYSSYVDASGKGIPIARDFDPTAPLTDGFTWFHLCAKHQATRVFLDGLEVLDSISIDALLVEDSRPRALIRDGTLLINLRAMNLWSDERPEDMISFRLWTDGRIVVSTRVRDIKSVDEMQRMIGAGEAPNTVGEFLTIITNRVYARMEPFLDEMEDKIGQFEELIAAERPDEVGQSIGQTRTAIAILQRFIVPQERLLNVLINTRLDFLRSTDIEHIVESHDRVVRYVESLRDLRERLQIINEEIGRASDAAQSRTSYMFALAATIFLPLSFLTGLLGVNVGGIPGAQSEIGFWVFGGICLAIIAVQVVVFRRNKWF